MSADERDKALADWASMIFQSFVEDVQTDFVDVIGGGSSSSSSSAAKHDPVELVGDNRNVNGYLTLMQ